MNGHGKVSKAEKRWEEENQCLSVTTSVTCDNTTQEGEEEKKKIPTAALEHFFFSSPFDHLNIFAVKDATGEQEKTAVLIKVHFCVCVCVFCANSSSWHSLFKDGRGTGWMLNCYVRQIVASDNQQPSAPSLTCHLRPNIIPLSSDRISLLQVANYFYPSLVLKRRGDLEITTE